MTLLNYLKIYTDGGSRGNPGRGACAAVIMEGNSEKIINKLSKLLGNTTNNLAEYEGVILGYNWLLNNYPSLKHNNALQKIVFYLDSQLVVRQLTRIYKVKDKKLLSNFLKIKQMEKTITDILNLPSIYYYFIPREENKIADFLLNQELDKK